MDTDLDHDLDHDLDAMSHADLVAEVRKLRRAIRENRTDPSRGGWRRDRV